MFAGRKKEKIRYGFMGLTRGSGTTHMAVSTAFCCSNHFGRKTAFIELSGHNEIENLREFEKGSPFNVFGTDFYPGVTGDELYEILNTDHDCFVMDLGCIEDGRINEFAICDRKFITGIFSPWNEQRLLSIMDEIKSNHKIINNVSGILRGSDRIKKTVEREYGIPVRSLPFIADAFDIKKENRAFFNELL